MAPLYESQAFYVPGHSPHSAATPRSPQTVEAILEDLVVPPNTPTGTVMWRRASPEADNDTSESTVTLRLPPFGLHVADSNSEPPAPSSSQPAAAPVGESFQTHMQSCNPNLLIGPHQPSEVLRRHAPPSDLDNPLERSFLADRVFSTFGSTIEPIGPPHMDASGRPGSVFWDAIQQAYYGRGSHEPAQVTHRNEMESLMGQFRRAHEIATDISTGTRAQTRQTEQMVDVDEALPSMPSATVAWEDGDVGQASESSTPKSSIQLHCSATPLSLSQLDGDGAAQASAPRRGDGYSQASARRRGGGKLQLPYKPGPAPMPAAKMMPTTAPHSATGNYRIIEAAGSSSVAMEIEALHLVRIAEAGITPIIRLPFEGERKYRRRIRDGLPPSTEDDIPIIEVRLGGKETLCSIPKAPNKGAEGTEEPIKKTHPAKKRKIMKTSKVEGKE